MAAIFAGSSPLLSSERTSRVIGPFLRWLKPDISDLAVQRVQLGVRKCGHLTEYAVLSMLLWRAIGRSRPFCEKSRNGFALGWAFLGSTLYAVSDEVHQSLVSSRFGSAWDVATDAVGAALGLALIRYRNRRPRPRHSDSQSR